MEKVAIWSEQYPVRFGAVDRSDTIRLSAAFDVFQEAAVSHAESLGVGREAMADSGQVWILSRMSARFDRRPLYGEATVARTWPRSWNKLFAIRDFDLRDSRGEAAIRARSCWLIIDIEKRRPLRPQTIMDSLPANEGLDVLSEIPAALPQREGLAKLCERKVSYNDLDYNGHVNNVSYIRWIEDCMGSAFMEEAARGSLDINFMHEVLPGETVEIWGERLEDAEGARAFALEGRKPSGDQPAFRAELRARS
ncbi:MAG: thioesterase [Treponema sp.]|nr:thioesterase [Treponema sp.]